MATLTKESQERLKRSVDECKTQWILACLPGDERRNPVTGPVGFFDWRLHGQLSRLARRDAFQLGQLCLVSGPKRLGAASLLLFIHDRGAKSPDLTKQLKKLGITSLSVEESSFPKDFFAQLKQNLDKEGISWTKLEWGSH